MSSDFKIGVTVIYFFDILTPTHKALLLNHFHINMKHIIPWLVFPLYDS